MCVFVFSDVHYDLNNIVTPLMSALSVWDCLKDTANDDALYDNIKNLLFIQVRIQHCIVFTPFSPFKRRRRVGSEAVAGHTHARRHTRTYP